MDQAKQHRPLNEELIKFVLPRELKGELQALASSRNISLSALLRLVISEYVKSRK
jgi:hypothetical protein